MEPTHFLPALATDVSPAQSCVARAKLEIKSSEGRLSAASLWKVQSQRKNKTELIFMSPIGTRLGMIELSATEKLWRDSKGQTPLHREPMLRKLISNLWMEQIQFLLGNIMPKALKHVLMDRKTQSTRYTTEDLTMECRAAQNSGRRCTVQTPGLWAQINFSLVRCEDPLESKQKS